MGKDLRKRIHLCDVHIITYEISYSTMMLTPPLQPISQSIRNRVSLTYILIPLLLGHCDRASLGKIIFYNAHKFLYGNIIKHNNANATYLGNKPIIRNWVNLA